MAENQASFPWGRMEWLAGADQENAQTLSVAKMWLAGGATSERHLHTNCEEAVLALSGEVEIQIGQSKQRCSAGECIVVPAQVPHAVTNLGASEAVLILMYGAGRRTYVPDP